MNDVAYLAASNPSLPDCVMKHFNACVPFNWPGNDHSPAGPHSIRCLLLEHAESAIGP